MYGGVFQLIRYGPEDAYLYNPELQYNKALREDALDILEINQILDKKVGQTSPTKMTRRLERLKHILVTFLYQDRHYFTQVMGPECIICEKKYQKTDLIGELPCKCCFHHNCITNIVTLKTRESPGL